LLERIKGVKTKTSVTIYLHQFYLLLAKGVFTLENFAANLPMKLPVGAKASTAA
jgi:hypothetical protein